ncbi:MAG: hypothetical protein MJ072_03910, partial [Clostridia bacterium]|nr:hypothetical protein [Clostridia bacterium]
YGLGDGNVNGNNTLLYFVRRDALRPELGVAQGTTAPALAGYRLTGYYVKNADGIDLRSGCHDILIENISGFCEDDTVALTNLPAKDQPYFVEGKCRDIHHVTVRNVRGASYCSFVRMLNQTDAKLYDVTVDTVVDETKDCGYTDNDICAVRVGDSHAYSGIPSSKETVYNITIKNVWGRGECAVSLEGETGEITLENINAFDGCPVAIKDLRK